MKKKYFPGEESGNKCLNKAYKKAVIRLLFAVAENSVYLSAND